MKTLPFVGLVIVSLLLIAVVIVGGGGALLGSSKEAPIISHSWHRIDPPDDSGFSECWLLMANLEPAGVTCR